MKRPVSFEPRETSIVPGWRARRILVLGLALREVGRMPEHDGLTEIPTSWATILTAHAPGPDSDTAMHDLIGRYHDAVGRYLKLKLRDSNLADEVAQEFWTKLLTHKLAGADPSKGRFRDYLRTVLQRLIIDHFRSKKLLPLPPGDVLDASSNDTDFDQVWRDTVIKRVWSRLDSYEVRTPKNRYATVLHLRVGNPDAPIDHLAAQLSQHVGTEVRPEAYRKTLQRARSKFLELLIQELRETIHPARSQDIEAEILDLGLGPLYRRYSKGNSV